MTLTLLSNIMVAVLLLATIGYAAVLNRRLGALRNDKAKLQELIQGLTQASTNAQAGIANLRQAADELGQQLEKKVAASRSLKDDLTYLIERGTGIADRLEGTVRARRDDAPTSERLSPAPRLGKAEKAAGEKVMALRTEADELSTLRRPGGAVSRTERDLLRALGGRR